MENYTMTRPSTSPMPVCAPSVFLMPANAAASAAVLAAPPATKPELGAQVSALIVSPAVLVEPSAQPVSTAVLAAERAPASVPALTAHKAILAQETGPISQAHQVRLQAELTRVRGGLGINGTTSTTSTTGFKGSDVPVKRYADRGNGVPPRGRPV